VSRVAADLPQDGDIVGEDGNPPAQCVDDGEAEALGEGGADVEGGGLVESLELLVADPAGQDHVALEAQSRHVTGERIGQAAARDDRHGSIGGGDGRESGEQPREVLVRHAVADAQHEGSARRQREGRQDAVGLGDGSRFGAAVVHHRDETGGNAEKAPDAVGRRVRHRDHAVGGLRRTTHEGRRHRALRALGEAAGHLVVDRVVHGDHALDAAEDRPEVGRCPHQVGPAPPREQVGRRDRAEGPRRRVGAHPRHRLHVAGEEGRHAAGAGTTGHRGEARLRQKTGDTGQQFADVGFGAPA